MKPADDQVNDAFRILSERGAKDPRLTPLDMEKLLLLMISSLGAVCLRTGKKPSALLRDWSEHADEGWPEKAAKSA